MSQAVHVSPMNFGWIPIFGILFPVFMLAVILGFVALMRYLRYRERMLFAQRGVMPQDDTPARIVADRPYASYRQLRNGIITSLVGLALLLGLWTMGTGPWLLGGLIPLAVGIGNLLTFVILSPTSDKGNDDSD